MQSVTWGKLFPPPWTVLRHVSTPALSSLTDIQSDAQTVVYGGIVGLHLPFQQQKAAAEEEKKGEDTFDNLIVLRLFFTLCKTFTALN